MRSGLVAIGIAFALVGGGLVASFLVLSSTGPASTQASSVSISNLGANGSQVWLFPAVGSGSGTLDLSWTSTGSANVSFWKTVPCSPSPSVCPIAPVLAAWPASTAGNWTGAEALGEPYLLVIGNLGRSALSFNGTLQETQPGAVLGLPTATLVMVAIGSVLLLATGAISLFLGLFLPGGTYRGPRAGPEFEDRVGAEDGPDDLSTDGPYDLPRRR